MIDLLAPRQRHPRQLRTESANVGLSQLVQKQISTIGDLECLLPSDEIVIDALPTAYRQSPFFHTMITLRLVNKNEPDSEPETTLSLIELAGPDPERSGNRCSDGYFDGRALSSSLSALTGIFKFLGRRRYMRTHRLTEK